MFFLNILNKSDALFMRWETRHVIAIVSDFGID